MASSEMDSSNINITSGQILIRICKYFRKDVHKNIHSGKIFESRSSKGYPLLHKEVISTQIHKH